MSPQRPKNAADPAFRTLSVRRCLLVLALYINSPQIEVLYSRPKVIWMLCVLMLYWISRIWMVAQRGKMHDDPVVFALKDKQSVAIGVLAAVVVALAT